ncbi:tetratricopeptide repeat protein [Humisphaera borealis]|uniref:Tetratricopeptide repeat protein n=1 Tax=Humisphaera borealis TaxID=2807512 RepID=A0A7M2WY34_9BACT|nr:hypothetical protein [Humisphaera borealis]QOV90437.1 hypothetical protein IPV69_03455 [Humisphaera borealis]
MKRIGRSLAFLVATAIPSAGLADTIWYGTGGAAIKAEGTVMKVEGGNLVWQNKSTGNSTQRPLDAIVKVNADGEAALNAAEDAYEAEKWDVAATNYDKAISASRKDWVKDRSVFRLVAAAEKAGQFPLSAKAFVQLAARDPNQAKEKKPAIPDDKALIGRAIPDVERAFATKQTDLVREFLGELYIANSEPDKAMRLLAGAPGADKNPALLVMQANAALSTKNYAAASDVINKNKALFTDPTHQLTALYTLAECSAATAGNDPAKRQDAAIAYMRVVAHFSNKSSPMVLSSLLKAAKLLEDGGQATEAAALYKQVAEDPKFKGSKSAADAKANYDRLAAAAKPK